MERATMNWAAWMTGPALGILLLMLALGVGFGPGFLNLSALGAVGLAVGVPLMQFVFNRTKLFAKRPMASSVVAISIVVAGLVGGVLSGAFFYW